MQINSQKNTADTALNSEEIMFKRHSVPQLSNAQACLSRNNFSLLLQKIDHVTETAIADVFQVHKSTVSRWKTEGDVEHMAQLLAALGLQVVPIEHAFDPKVVQALMTLAGANLTSATTPEELFARIE